MFLRVDPKTVTPEEITERMQQIDALVPQPIYDEKTFLKRILTLCLHKIFQVLQVTYKQILML
jgi:hypothetical protein